jgi:hypothetical protein
MQKYPIISMVSLLAWTIRFFVHCAYYYPFSLFSQIGKALVFMKCDHLSLRAGMFRWINILGVKWLTSKANTYIINYAIKYIGAGVRVGGNWISGRDSLV